MKSVTLSNNLSGKYSFRLERVLFLFVAIIFFIFMAQKGYPIFILGLALFILLTVWQGKKRATFKGDQNPENA